MVSSDMYVDKNGPAEEHVQVVAFYDPGSGKILHLHMVTTFGGIAPLTEDEAIAEAKAQARRRNPEVDRLAIALSNDAEHGRFPHSIDPNTRAFVPLREER
jgi:hypothetical protein